MKRNLLVIGAVVAGFVLLFVAFLGVVLIMGYIEVENDYYAEYSDIDSEGGIHPESFPSSAFDIHTQFDYDLTTLWMRFQVNQDDKEEFASKLQPLADDEITIEILFAPSRDVDWWFTTLSQIEPDNEYSLDADVYYEDCRFGVFHEGYYAIDKDSQYVYYWCS